MTRKITHCRKLKYKYDPDTGIAVFEDGTRYTAAEMIHIAKHKTTIQDEDALHLVKRIFDGELIIRKMRI